MQASPETIMAARQYSRWISWLLTSSFRRVGWALSCSGVSPALGVFAGRATALPRVLPQPARLLDM